MTKIVVGTKVRFQHPTSNGGVVTFTARVVKVEDRGVWVEMPECVRRMPFAPLGGKRYGLYSAEKLVVVG